jgi:hypothetical protein
MNFTGVFKEWYMHNLIANPIIQNYIVVYTALFIVTHIQVWENNVSFQDLLT